MGANLEEAQLVNAKLERACLQGAKLEGADLRRANLVGVRHLLQSEIEKARGDRTTQFPAYLKRPVLWTQQSGS
jgi:uncharacterized protein YjbI with pentapeptide repeats